MSCSVCRQPEYAGKRLEWGCDGPTGNTLAIACPMCDGLDKDCEECAGTARVPVRDCPNRILTSDEFDVVRTVTMLEAGVTPTGHGWYELPHWLLQAMAVVTKERRRIEEAKRG